MVPARTLTDATRQSGPQHGAMPRIVAIGGGTGLPNVLRGRPGHVDTGAITADLR